ncbi:MAG: hypothetical protein Q7S17_10465 [Xanthobacteraceae bacterium]|nr:hypothetical protein [Xanthobacteraceae bacterium]
MPIGDGKLVGAAVSARFPIAGKILETIGPEIINALRAQPATGKSIKEVADAVAPIIEKIAKADPVMVNDLGAEPVLKSRIVVMGTMALITTLFTIVNQLAGMFQAFSLSTFDYVTAGGLMGSVVFIVWTLYGRLKEGLRPLHWFGLARP